MDDEENTFHHIRSSKYDLDPSWIPIYLRPNRPGYRCSNIIQRPDGEYRMCSFSGRKKACYMHQINNGPHFYNIPRSQDYYFPADFENKLLAKQIVHMKNDIYDNLAVLVGELGISSIKGSSKSFSNFIKRCISEGIMLAKRNPNFTPLMIQNIDINISDKSLSKRINRMAEERKIDRLIYAKQVKFVNIVSDAGTILSIKNLWAIYTNPTDNNFPIILDLFQNCGYTAEDYELFFSSLIQTTKNNDLILLAIIVDNLKPQVIGLNKVLQSPDNYIRSIIHIPCFAHMTNLVFVNLLSLPQFKSQVNEILELTNILRKKEAVQNIGLKCPSISKTRWLYLFDILLFILQNQEKINIYISTLNLNIEQSHKNFEILFKALLPLKIFCLIVESKNTCLNEIVEIVQSIVQLWERLFPNPNVEVDDFLSNALTFFYARLLHNAFQYSILSYLFTSAGRHFIRQENRGYRVRGTNNLYYHSSNLELIDVLYKSFLAKAKILYIDEEHEEVITQNDNQSNIDKMEIINIYNLEKQHKKELEKDILSSNITFKETISELDKMSFKEKMKMNIYKELYREGLKTLESYSEILNINPELIIEQFDIWLFDDPTKHPFEQLLNKSPVVMWQMLSSYSKEWELFAYIGLRLSQIGVSEADAERILKNQKEIQASKMTNISTESMQARMILYQNI